MSTDTEWQPSRCPICGDYHPARPAVEARPTAETAREFERIADTPIPVKAAAPLLDDERLTRERLDDAAQIAYLRPRDPDDPSWVGALQSSVDQVLELLVADTERFAREIQKATMDPMDARAGAWGIRLVVDRIRALRDPEMTPQIRSKNLQPDAPTTTGGDA